MRRKWETDVHWNFWFGEHVDNTKYYTARRSATDFIQLWSVTVSDGGPWWTRSQIARRKSIRQCRSVFGHVAVTKLYGWQPIDLKRLNGSCKEKFIGGLTE